VREDISRHQCTASASNSSYPDVEIRQGDCFEGMKDEMPFDLLFMDIGIRHILTPPNWDWFTEMVKVGENCFG
jgi:protein-L-isoaspartate O-methyltransferase